MRGPKPTPTRIKQLQGNPGKRRLNEREPRPTVRIPACPRELSPAARKEWRRIARQLAAMRVLSELDRAVLAAYCSAYALWIEAGAAIQKHGAMVKSPSGFPMQSPYLAMANKQIELMIRIAAEFGLTPSSRSRVSAGKAPATYFDAEQQAGEEPDLDAFLAANPSRFN